jgi:hypothetical protein
VKENPPISDPVIIVTVNNIGALLIGQLILSWGLFDQRLYSQIIRFESEKYIRNPIGDAPKMEEIIDYSFEVRVKRLRKLSVELCNGNSKIMARVDDVVRRLNQLSLIRHHLVHGHVRVSAAPGRAPAFEVWEHREQRKQQKVLTRKILQHKYKPTSQDFELSYTFEEVKEARTKMDKLYKEFSNVMNKVLEKGTMRTTSTRSGGGSQTEGVCCKDAR